jgi:hypothetical protein
MRVPCVFAALSTVLIAGTVQAQPSVRPKVTPSQPNCIIDPQNPACRIVVQGEGATGVQGGLSIVSFRGSVLVSDPQGTSFMFRATLDANEAYGSDYDDGFSAWPTGSEPGQLTGMNWPFRDFMNFDGDPPPIPGGNNASPRNGNFDGSSLFNIDGQQNLDLYPARGNPAFGFDGAINLFSLVLGTTDFRERDIQVAFFPSGERPFEVLLPNGNIIVPNILAPEVLTIRVIPSPASAGALALAGCLFSARRRR